MNSSNENEFVRSLFGGFFCARQLGGYTLSSRRQFWTVSASAVKGKTKSTISDRTGEPFSKRQFLSNLFSSSARRRNERERGAVLIAYTYSDHAEGLPLTFLWLLFLRQLLSPNIQQKHYLNNGYAMDGGRHVSNQNSIWLSYNILFLLFCSAPRDER